MKLSIAMIVKDEEKYIENTLKPLKKLQNYIDSEIIIVDTGSSDNTVEIAKKYTDKIYFHEWNNNFSDMRNISIKYCNGDYILIVDADEVLYDVEKLSLLVNSKNFIKHNGALIKIIDFNKSIENSINNGGICALPRIFKNGTVQYEGSVHEQPKIDYPLIDTNIRFIHYGYNNNDYELMEYKFSRNLNLLFNELKSEPQNIYTYFQIANSYNTHNDLDEALKYIKIAYNKAKSYIGEHIYVLSAYCAILYRLKEFHSLLDKAKEGLKYCDDFIDFYFYLGESYYNLNQYDKSIKVYEKYLYYYDKLKNDIKISNTTLVIFTRNFKNNILCNLAVFYYKNEFYEKALNTIIKIDDASLLKNKAFLMLKIILEGKLWNSINIVDKFIDVDNYESILIYVDKKVVIDELKIISELKLDGNLKEIVCIVKHFKGNEKISREYINKAKNIICRNKILYSIYVYYILKYDINEIKHLITYGKDKLENILLNLCNNYFDFNGVLLEGLYTIEFNNVEDALIRTTMQRALLLSGKLPNDKKKDIFLDYTAQKYFVINKYYNMKLIKENIWMLPSEDRAVIELKNALEYKYYDRLKYVRYMKDILDFEKSYAEYIKILTDEEEENINVEIKVLIPKLVKNINMLIDNEKYQEAYNTIEEALSMVKFDFDLMVLKYNLLIQFNYEEEARNCLRDIILYGDSERVSELIYEI